MVQYGIPNLLNHLQAYVKSNSSNIDILEAKHTAWIDKCCIFSDLHKKAWKDTRIPLAVSTMFPESSLEHSLVTSEYLILSRLIEQLTDEPATSIQAQKWANIFKQALGQTLGETGEPAAEIIKEWRNLKYSWLSAADTYLLT
ncbi:hypothetical protein C0992_001078 [Termitomyces sp. T32_za158]|nr:hypothetical protein C0992_001078 [Termitomyces sp. T32_za158]